MRVAANGCPSRVPPTLTGRRVPSASAEPGTVTNVAKAPSFSIGAVKVRSKGRLELLTTHQTPGRRRTHRVTRRQPGGRKSGMRAISYSRPGGPDVLELTDRPIPEPGPGEVRVRVAFSGVNPTDWKSRTNADPGPD